MIAGPVHKPHEVGPLFRHFLGGEPQLKRHIVEWAAHEWGIEGKAQEIVKRYTFGEFVDAVEFMRWAAPRINDEWQPPHHPRWENQWRLDGLKTAAVALLAWKQT